MKINPTETVNELIDIITYIADVEDKRKIYHSWRVAILSGQIAKGITSPKIRKDIFYAALLHDIGGVGFPYHIIHYLRRNDKTSRNVLLSHPIIGAQLVSNIPQMSNPAKLILDHHEWINGKGYPRAKTANDIPLGAQVIRFADSIDIALQSNQSHKIRNLKKRMYLNIGKEYSKRMFGHGFRMLSRNGFFPKVTKRSNMPLLFKKARGEIGFIHIPLRIDAIGTALDVAAQIIDMKHPYSSGHSQRVSRYAMAIALAMNLKHDEITLIKWAGLIHDIGKLNVSRRILSKRGRLNSKEYNHIKKHAQFTRTILKMIPSLEDIVEMSASHHEYYDGSGYPQGLAQEKIPLGARILAICDAFDAMTSNRPYRNPLTPEAACKEIERMSGKQFDPAVVKIAIPLFKNLGL